MRSIRTIEKYLDSHGIESEVFETAPDRGNLLASIPGSGSGPSLMLGPGHVDVVPVQDESNWEVPPFEGKIKDGFIWGRGTQDMLQIVASQVAVFAHLYSEGFKPRGDLKLLVVADEEAGGVYGAGWMVKNHPEKVKVDYVITESGGFEFAPNRFLYAYGEKGVSWMRLRFKGTEQHGSMPYNSDNAILKLSEATNRIASYKVPVRTDAIETLVADMDIGGLQKWMITKKSILPRLLGMISKSDTSRARLLHALSHMTMSPNMCAGGTKVNIVPGAAWLDVDIRTLPGQDRDYVVSHLKQALGPLANEVEISDVPAEAGAIQSVGSISSCYSPLVGLMESVLRELRGESARLVPMLMVGGTDCRFFRQAFGTNSYGFSVYDGKLPLSTLSQMAHGDNERVSLGTIDLTSKAYKEIAIRLLS